MRRELKTSCRRAFCLALTLLVLFFSYRPAIALLSLAGAAKNPTDGRVPGQRSEVDARENLPRPAKKQHRAESHRSIQRIQKARSVTPEEKTLLVVQMKGPRPCLASSIRSSFNRGMPAPDYLRLFLPATPGSPHSPPA